MRVLVLGGTHFVGRSIVDAALERGDEVSSLNRGSRPATADIRSLIADRTDPKAVAHAVDGRKWDVVIDTWTGAPRVLSDSCAPLADRAGHYAYVSSWVVYRPPVPVGADESAATIDGDPDDEADNFYPVAKRGCELAVQRAFADRSLITRPGPMLGPYEDVGSLTWWLRRIHRGGRVLAPGCADDPFQYVDVRDHAPWLLDAAERGVGGVFNTVCVHGRCTMGELLETMREVTGSDAELVWVPDDDLLAAGVRPYVDIPLWLPAAMRGGINDVDVSAAHRAGLDTSRPLRDTLADSWSWLEREGEPPWQGATTRGLDPAVEQRVLDQVG
ncbi:NAD-dependent epimerase/dehydratase family protein [Streptomyces sp. ISL-100]|uniref:NAD-dependent epimerase/dehydratase family protein n=1 Tax=Streptomyces sp. ISL-100 TaxID=2819173 RepID=UPI001BEC241C|nr:NAD-dependent epimerase/dehydratase family protein [Streptomyces sp. ISL-100]MBT2399859.1 NAD-dependent epimerase/dehydratase family protein [Streptomyces sp. ISL-100]